MASLTSLSVATSEITDRASWLAQRREHITASVAAALWDVHPYMTLYELFARKSGLIAEDIRETPAMRRGRLLEDDALELLREERPEWTALANRRYFHDDKLKLGATPDAMVSDPVRGSGIAQIKTVGKFAFKNSWHLDGEVQAPDWIAIQANVEAWLAGASWACIAAMVIGDGGLDLHVIDVPLKPKLMEGLVERTREFWRRVEANEPYSPDYGRDAQVISRIFADDDGSEIDLTENPRIIDLVAQREALKQIEAQGSAAGKQRKAVDAEIIHAMGNSSRAIINRHVLEAKTVRRAAYEVEPSSFRVIKVRERT